MCYSNHKDTPEIQMSEQNTTIWFFRVSIQSKLRDRSDITYLNTIPVLMFQSRTKDTIECVRYYS